MSVITIATPDILLEKLLTLLAEQLPEPNENIVLLDVAQMGRMPEFSGSRVVLFTASADPGYLTAAKTAGADGFWYLHPSAEELARVLAGEPAFPEKTPTIQLGKVTSHDLTPRELDVLRQLTRGSSDGEIAVALRCSLSTVKHYVSSLREKTGISSRVELAVRANSTGLIDFS